jgi:hypothetical protein
MTKHPLILFRFLLKASLYTSRSSLYPKGFARAEGSGMGWSKGEVHWIIQASYAQAGLAT